MTLGETSERQWRIGEVAVMEPADFAGAGNPIHVTGQADVHADQVRLVLYRRSDGSGTGACNVDHPESHRGQKSLQIHDQDDVIFVDQ